MLGRNAKTSEEWKSSSATRKLREELAMSHFSAASILPSDSTPAFSGCTWYAHGA